MPASHYDVLGVDASAGEAEIKAAYKKRALSCHPDKGGNAEEFKAVASAYATLSNPASRREYDAELAAPRTPRSWSAPASRGFGAPAPPCDLDFAERLFQDFFAHDAHPFSSIFGGGSPFSASPFSASPFGGSPFGAFRGAPFGAPLGAFGSASFGAPFGGSLIGGGGARSGFTSFSSSSSSWSSGGPARSIEQSSTFENGVRVTRTRETLTHADGRVEVLRDDTVRDDGAGSGAPRIEHEPSRRALPGIPPRRANTYETTGKYHTRI